uniref:Secreted protein n=1 Tax=Plectus sambesii TaxID=2011161 RepID=A0A914XMS2_9BILA
MSHFVCVVCLPWPGLVVRTQTRSSLVRRGTATRACCVWGKGAFYALLYYSDLILKYVRLLLSSSAFIYLFSHKRLVGSALTRPIVHLY